MSEIGSGIVVHGILLRTGESYTEEIQLPDRLSLRERMSALLTLSSPWGCQSRRKAVTKLIIGAVSCEELGHEPGIDIY